MILNRRMITSRLLSHFCQQEWYEGYLALLQMRVHSENLVWGEQQILAKLQGMYTAADCREHRSCLTLAMLLYADPLTLPVPLEVDLFPEGLYADGRSLPSSAERLESDKRRNKCNDAAQ